MSAAQQGCHSDRVRGECRRRPCVPARWATGVLAGALLLVPGLLAAQAPAPAGGDASADFVLTGAATGLPAPLPRVLEDVRASDLEAHIRFLASPHLEGRGLGTPQLEAAADYVAAVLAVAGVPPAVAVPGSRPTYFQAVPMRRIVRPGGQVTIESLNETGRRVRTFSARLDCLLPEISPQLISGQVVFAGYGIREPALGHDDYGGLDVRGKIVAVMGGVPPGAEWQKPDLLARYATGTGRDRYDRKVEIARGLGARALIALEGAAFAAALSEEPAVPPPFFLPDEDLEAQDLPLVLASGAVSRSLLGVDAAAAGKPRLLAGVTATIRVTGDEEAVHSRNVIAVVHGSDPALRGEAVVIGAHMDHLGRRSGVVHPGADDNASGTAALLEIAGALAASPRKPKRTVVFAFWTGEEEGHLGSEHYVQHPVWPLDHTTLYANLDMIAHPWLRQEIEKLVADARLPGGDRFLAQVRVADFVEPGVAAWAPELRPVLVQAARGLGLSLHFDWTDGKHGGSDYRAFARKDLRFIRFFGNYFPGYHEPSDTPDGVDAAHVRKIAALALATVWLVADR